MDGNPAPAIISFFQLRPNPNATDFELVKPPINLPKNACSANIQKSLKKCKFGSYFRIFITILISYCSRFLTSTLAEFDSAQTEVRPGDFTSSGLHRDYPLA